jgi:uncharacterized membrane protein
MSSTKKLGRKAAAAAAQAKMEHQRFMIGFGVLMGLFVIVIAVIIIASRGGLSQASSAPRASLVVDEDVVIPLSGVTSTASFYPVQIDGEQMELFAVKASDGSIKTAFNTCKDCYNSGNGYYIQDGSTLVCQNCRNIFSIENVGEVSGGCNPVPISDENKIVGQATITIPRSFLAQTKLEFDSWKVSQVMP